MSFTRFIYLCALAGGWGALIGWGFGRGLVRSDNIVLRMGLLGLYLGVCLAMLLAMIDGLWNQAGRPVQIAVRVIIVGTLGGLAGLLGGILGQSLYDSWQGFFIIGWTLTGLLIGAALGFYDLLGDLLIGRTPQGSIDKMRNGLIGGTVGGILGGLLCAFIWSHYRERFAAKPYDQLFGPSGIGFTVLGMCIGLLIGLAQVLLKDAWLKVEAGFRKGRELILAGAVTTIGRAEDCDIGLFGDPAVEKLHARIERRGNDFVLVDAGSASGTYVNDERIDGPRVLRAGDVIRMGRCLLRFGERPRAR
jgi:hypothetical protein